MTLSAKLSSVSSLHLNYINSSGKRYIYKTNSNSVNVLNEVHIFTDGEKSIDTAASFVMPLNWINKIEVIQHDGKRTTSNHILTGVGVGLGVVAVAAIIVALTKSSCPYLSVYDGYQFNLQGELFGGAVYPQLERSDYLPITVEKGTDNIQLRISNELKEKQFTNFANLLQIEHPENIQPYVDADGKVYQVAQPVPAHSALLNNRVDVIKNISEKDFLFCSFDDTLSTSGINEIIFSFAKKETEKKGKLLLDLKNSYWFDFLYGEFTANFGARYAKWQQKQQKKPAVEMKKWATEQHIPLQISVLTDKGWTEIWKVNTIGPLANRSILIPVNLESVSGKEVQLKISTGFMFWEIDYAAMDFTTEQPITVNILTPRSAIDHNDQSVMNELAKDDNQYLAQPEVGDYAILNYTISKKPQPGNTYSYVFYTSGYYMPIRDYKGRSNFAFLKKFSQPGELSKYSLNRYQQVPKEYSGIALKNDR